MQLSHKPTGWRAPLAAQLGESPLHYSHKIRWRKAKNRLTQAGMLALVGCCALPAVQAEDCPTHALYDVDTKKLTIPFVDVPLLDPWTGNMTNEVAVFSAELEQLKGVEDFSVLSDMFVFIETADAPDDCHAQYWYAKDEKFADGGRLYIPFVDVPSIMVLPPNIQVPGPVRVLEATLRQLALDSEVFHLDSYCNVDDENCGSGNDDPPDDPPDCDCDENTPLPACGDCELGACDSMSQNDIQVFEAIFMEPYVLYEAINDMVVVDYWTSGEWPIPLSNSITPPTGNFTAGFVSGDETDYPTYLEATMRSQAELEAALAAFGYVANETCLAEIAGKAIRFNFSDSTSSWTCSVDLPDGNGVPPQYLDIFPMAPCN